MLGLFFCLFSQLFGSGSGFGVILEESDLNFRNGKYYRLNSNIPYSGKIVNYWPGKNQYKSILKYKNGILNGLCKYYYENGQLEYLFNSKNGQLDGSCINYYENGQLSQRAHYRDGEFNGPVKWYHESGEEAGYGKWEDGLFYLGDSSIPYTGMTTAYYENGQRHFISNFKNGKPHGLNKVYYKNGSLEYSGNYKNGELVD